MNKKRSSRMGNYSKRSQALSQKRLSLLEALRQEEGLESASLQKIPRRKDDSAMPASFAQQRLWLLDQLAPGSPFYTILVVLRLTGQLHVAVLQNSLNEIVRRHESLRTTFVMAKGAVMQQIDPASHLPLA